MQGEGATPDAQPQTRVPDGYVDLRGHTDASVDTETTMSSKQFNATPGPDDPQCGVVGCTEPAPYCAEVARYDWRFRYCGDHAESKLAEHADLELVDDAD